MQPRPGQRGSVVRNLRSSSVSRSGRASSRPAGISDWVVFWRSRISDFGTVTDARTASTAVFYPGTGRSVYVGMRYAFN